MRFSVGYDLDSFFSGLPLNSTHVMDMSVYQLIIPYTRHTAGGKVDLPSYPPKGTFPWTEVSMEASIHKKGCFCGQDGTKQAERAHWRRSRSLLCATDAELVPFFNDFSTSYLQNLQFDAKNNIAGASLSRKWYKL